MHCHSLFQVIVITHLNFANNFLTGFPLSGLCPHSLQMIQLNCKLDQVTLPLKNFYSFLLQPNLAPTSLLQAIRCYMLCFPVTSRSPVPITLFLAYFSLLTLASLFLKYHGSSLSQSLWSLWSCYSIFLKPRSLYGLPSHFSQVFTHNASFWSVFLWLPCVKASDLTPGILCPPFWHDCSL